MLAYILKRIFTMIPLFFGITIVSFLVIHLAPGSPISIQTDLNPKMTAEARERLKAFYGLDKPLPIQYYNWLKHLIMLDLGRSFSPDNRPVIDKIKERLPITIFINVLALGLILVVAIPLGVLSAVYQDSLFDRTTTVFVFIGFAIPTFWLALLLMILFGIYLGWLPISGLKSINYEYLSFINQIKDRAAHLLMPVLLSAFGGLAGLSRYSRSNMLEVIRQDYITTARAKGLREFIVIFRHALKNALISIVTIVGMYTGVNFAGSIMIEMIFARPGMGKLLISAIKQNDYTMVQSVILVYCVIIITINLITDLVYGIIDPRIVYK